MWMEHIYQSLQSNPMAHWADGIVTKAFLERPHMYAAKAYAVRRILEVCAFCIARAGGL